VAVEDNYDRLGYPPAAVTREARYSRYVSDTVMLRSHTSAGIPPALRALAAAPAPPDVLLVLPGLTYRRDVVDRLHVGTPHQVDLWRIVRDRPVAPADLLDMVDALVGAVLPGARWRSEPTSHPYTTGGQQIDVQTADGWVELAECGLIAPHVLATAGLDPHRYTGLALGMGLDRALMLRKGVPDIRLLRAADPRIAGQMLDLTPWRPVSALPPIRRDLSLVLAEEPDEELIGDRVRTALGPDVDLLESVAVRASTAHEDLPGSARSRLGTRPGQHNVLLRLVLRPVDRTLTDAEANAVRDRVYAALHEGPHAEWAAS
jgi:phenylalanyl-tRNA synthetase alpha chain